ncbi:hypothetical protein TNCV_2845621 [Trichonephila clavipes]|nr:hypothetical protein TNCV_2845621 [Trichonephila clavipes]
MLNLNIAFPSTPTRFGHNSANTIDIALLKTSTTPLQLTPSTIFPQTIIRALATELTSTLSTLLIKRLRLEMANLPTDMKLELAESQRNATRTPSPQLTPCEQLKYSKKPDLPKWKPSADESRPASTH